MTAPLLVDGPRLRRSSTAADLVAAVERALVALDRGEIELAPTVHLPGDGGGFHVKSAASASPPRRAVVKINGNFSRNPERHGLPTIQGLVALLDGERGGVLALVDSIALTALRTAAVSALAARLLAGAGRHRLAIVGCGLQGAEHLELFAAELPLDRVALFDPRPGAAAALARRAEALGLPAILAESAAAATRGSTLIVTATPARRPFLATGDVARGAFVAAVGADNPEKSELEPELLADSVVIVDSLPSAAAGGDLRSAIAAGAMSGDAVRAELAAVVTGRSPGRSSPEERIVFDSTGLAATDLAVASLAFDALARAGDLPRFDFAAAGD
jgi:ornithine cyclodeaminase/alanine dehydrogenase-like protein (mu-crystallin family)